MLMTTDGRTTNDHAREIKRLSSFSSLISRPNRTFIWLRRLGSGKKRENLSCHDDWLSKERQHPAGPGTLSTCRSNQCQTLARSPSTTSSSGARLAYLFNYSLPFLISSAASSDLRGESRRGDRSFHVHLSRAPTVCMSSSLEWR